MLSEENIKIVNEVFANNSNAARGSINNMSERTGKRPSSSEITAHVLRIQAEGDPDGSKLNAYYKELAEKYGIGYITDSSYSQGKKHNTWEYSEGSVSMTSLFNLATVKDIKLNDSILKVIIQGQSEISVIKAAMAAQIDPAKMVMDENGSIKILLNDFYNEILEGLNYLQDSIMKLKEPGAKLEFSSFTVNYSEKTNYLLTGSFINGNIRFNEDLQTAIQNELARLTGIHKNIFQLFIDKGLAAKFERTPDEELIALLKGFYYSTLLSVEELRDKAQELKSEMEKNLMRSIPNPITAPINTDTNVIPASPVLTSLNLNGAQIASATAIVENVSKGDIPRESGINQLIVFLGLTKEQAEAVMGEAGKGTVIKADKVIDKK